MYKQKSTEVDGQAGQDIEVPGYNRHTVEEGAVDYIRKDQEEAVLPAGDRSCCTAVEDYRKDGQYLKQSPTSREAKSC